MDEKFQVFYHGGKAHLSEDGHTTFCGESISRLAGFAQSQPATLNEFIEEVRPRCSGCRFSAKLEWAILERARRAHYPLQTADTMARGTGGVYYHAHDHDARESGGKALCGLQPGKRGYWSTYFGKAVTCPKCLKIIEREQ